MEPNNSNFFPYSEEFPNSQENPNAQYYSNSQFYQNSPVDSNFQENSNSQFFSNPTQIPLSANIPFSQNASQNFGENAQTTSKKYQKTPKATPWCVKEDLALMSAYCFVSEDKRHGNNQKGAALWRRVADIFEQTRAENPTEINSRNLDQMKGRYKRLNENAQKWIAAYKESYRLKRSGMSMQDVQAQAMTIYEQGGSKFGDLHVFDEIMSKHPKWQIKVDRDLTRSYPEDEGSNEESRNSSKRSRTGEDGEFSIPSNSDTPISNASPCSRPSGRDMAKRKGKSVASQSSSIPDEFTAELRELRLTRNNEAEIMNRLGTARLAMEKERNEIERKKEERKAKKMNVQILTTLMSKDQLTPEEEELKHKILSTLFNN